MTAGATAHLLLLLALLCAAACEARPGLPLLGHSRRHLLQAQLPASDAAGTVVSTGSDFVSALLNADVHTVLLRGQLLQCGSPFWLWLLASPSKGPCKSGRCTSFRVIIPWERRPCASACNLYACAGCWSTNRRAQRRYRPCMASIVHVPRQHGCNIEQSAAHRATALVLSVLLVTMLDHLFC